MAVLSRISRRDLKRVSFLIRLTKFRREHRACIEKKSGWLSGHPVGGEVIVTSGRSASPPASGTYLFMYSRLNASASISVRSASFIFLSLSVTSSTRA